MSSPQIGKNIFNQSIARGRQQTTIARAALRRIIEEQPGPQTTAVLIAKTALAIGEISAVLEELDEIGRSAKATGPLPNLEK